MSLLTSQELESAWDNACDARAYGEAIEAAVIAKLAGVSVEPVAYQRIDTEYNERIWDEDSFTSHPNDLDECMPLYDSTAIAAARVMALEEAARLLESTELSGMNNDIQLQVFVGRLLIEYCKAIRALKETP